MLLADPVLPDYSGKKNCKNGFIARVMVMCLRGSGRTVRTRNMFWVNKHFDSTFQMFQTSSMALRSLHVVRPAERQRACARVSSLRCSVTATQPCHQILSKLDLQRPSHAESCHYLWNCTIFIVFFCQCLCSTFSTHDTFRCLSAYTRTYTTNSSMYQYTDEPDETNKGAIRAYVSAPLLSWAC